MARWSVSTIGAVSVTLGIALAVACGGKEEPDHQGVDYEPEGGSTSVPPDAYVPDVTCSPVGSLRECTIYLKVNGVNSCFTGQDVCQGDDGWSGCMETLAATELATALKAAAVEPEPEGTAGAPATADESTVGGATN